MLFLNLFYILFGINQPVICDWPVLLGNYSRITKKRQPQLNEHRKSCQYFMILEYVQFLVSTESKQLAREIKCLYELFFVLNMVIMQK